MRKELQLRIWLNQSAPALHAKLWARERSILRLDSAVTAGDSARGKVRIRFCDVPCI